MVYYNVLITNNLSNKVSTSDTAATNSSLHSDVPHLQPLDKRALYTCLKKMTGEMNRQPDIQLRCVEQASTFKDDVVSFQKWLEKELFVLFTEDEMRGLLAYIRLHSWGPTIIRDSAFISKMFEVPTPLNYTAWYANIDNMQIRSQFRNSLILRPERKTAAVNLTSSVKSEKSPDRKVRIAEFTQKENIVIAKDTSRLEQLQQKYLNRSSAASLGSDSTITYTTTSCRKSRQATNRPDPTGLLARPLPRLVVLSKQKQLSTAAHIQKKKKGKRNDHTSYNNEIFDDYESFNYPSDDSSASTCNSSLKGARNRRGNRQRDSPSLQALPPSPIRKLQYIAPSSNYNSDIVNNNIDNTLNNNINNNNFNNKLTQGHRSVCVSIQIPRVCGM